jgi:nitroimidazol reductase NimA-like FMN-containing flavoprotein (pyridoxamine 5'-phosphate oxidase superfamily)
VADLSPTRRTRLTREKERGRSNRAELMALLDEAIIAHIGVVAGEHPVVVPVAFAVDPDGPDEGGTLYVHGSVGAGWMRRAPGTDVCVTVTAVDGLVLARSAFNHSMNYRCAVVIGRARLVEDADERTRAMSLTVDHVVPGRAATLRPNTRKELAATAMLAVPLHEASLKMRTGGAHDEPEDVEAGTWAGVLPLRVVAGEVEPDPETSLPVPDDVRRRAAQLRERPGQ